MLLTSMKGKQKVLIACFLFLGACKQNEFYDKSQLLDSEKAPTSAEADPTVSSANPTDGQNPTGGQSPPVVAVPPVNVPDPILNDRKEIFTQNSFKEGDVDILWMIDNSGSMANKQKRLSESLGIFIDKFLNKNINFKMAITTSDGRTAHNGKMIGDANKLTSSYLKLVGKTEFMSYFQSIVKVGTSGSGTEQGLKTSSTFFDRYATSFLRHDANLAVVEISDEEDQSETSVSVYLNKLFALKANIGMIKIYSVVTKVLPDDHTLGDSIGNRYIEATNITGGISSEIKNDFSTTLLDIGSSILTLIDSYALAEAPYNNAISVYVNKREVKTGWTYDPISHSVKFSAGSVPAEGATIEINYKVKATVLGAI